MVQIKWFVSVLNDLKIQHSETFKITSPIVSEVGITVAVQPNDHRLVLNVVALGYLL